MTIQQLFHALTIAHFHPSCKLSNIRHKFHQYTFGKKFKLSDHIQGEKNDYVFIFVKWESNHDIDKLLKEFYYQEEDLLNMSDFTDIDALSKIYGVTPEERGLNDW